MPANRRQFFKKGTKQMALHWDITNCKNMESLKVEETGEWAITHSLIWLTIAVDMGQITDKNIGEFYARTKVWEALTGGMVKNGSEDYFLTFADIHKRIGLTTNVCNVTITNWFKRINKMLTENRYGTMNGISDNKIKAVYYSAIAEIEDYSASTEWETQNA